jgi:hypothetical protein
MAAAPVAAAPAKRVRRETRWSIAVLPRYDIIRCVGKTLRLHGMFPGCICRLGNV